MINSRRLEDLEHEVELKARTMIRICRDEGIDLLVTSTLRDFESQNALYAQGRTSPGKIVTNARGGSSFHNYGVAFDVVPLVNGKPNWDDEELWQKIGEIGEDCGLEWAGRWASFKEMAHFQDTGGQTLAQLRTAHENGTA